MKTKSHASKARVSKIPPNSHSILTLAIAQLAKLTPTTDPEVEPPHPQNPNATPPDASHDNHLDDIDLDLQVPDTPPSPIRPDENLEKGLTCSGKDCSVSIDECGELEDCVDDDGRFYCPSCLYKSAVDEFRLVEDEFKSAKERALEARRGLFQFVGGECVSGNAGQGIGMVADEVVMGQLDNVDGETGNRSGNGNGNRNSGVEKDWNKDDSISGMGNKERDKSMVDQRESSDGTGNNVEDENGNGDSRVVDIGGKSAALSPGVCDREQHVSSRNMGMVDRQCTSVSRGSGDGDGNNVEDENGNRNSSVDIGGRNAASSSGVCDREQYVSGQNEGMADQQCTSVSWESGNGNGNHVEDENENRVSRVDIGGKNVASSSRVCNREQYVSTQRKGMVAQQCTSVSREIGDENGNNLDNENEIRNSRENIRRKNAASSSRACNKEKHASRQNKGMVDQQSSSVSGESSGEEGLDLLDDHNGWRQPRPKTRDAVKKFQNGGDNGHLRHLKGKIGVESRDSQNVSTDVGDPFSVYHYQDESVGRVGNTNPPELRKRPRETSSDGSEVNISERSAKRPLKSIMPESKRAFWTSEEEDMLMKAVERFSLNCRKNMSWASVMEYGRDVFHASRTADSLRDKWRAMVKKGRRGRK